MAGERISGHVRADSVIDGIDPIRKTLVTAQNFCGAVSSFTSNDGFKALTEVLELLPQRENEIKAQNETISKLKDQLAAQKQSQDVYAQQQLSDFVDRYNGWIEENRTLETKAQQLQAVCDAKEKELAALQEDLKMNKSRADDLEAESAAKTKRLEEVIQQAGISEEKLQNMQTAMDNQLKEVEQLRNEIADGKKLLEDSEKNNQILEEKAAKTNKLLENNLQYSVEMQKLNLSKTTKRIEDLWQSAIRLIVNFAGRELSKDVLQIDWNELRKNDVFKDKIPLPQSNSDIARMMRVATVLAAFASLVDRFVFQPTYLLHENSRLREVLCQQASIDPGKERFARGILLSMSSDTQEANSKESKDVLDSVLDELLNNAMIKSLFTPEDISVFDEAMEGLVIQFQEEWEIVQCGKQKLEANFCHSYPTDHPWHIVNMRATKFKEDQNNKASFDSSNFQEDDIVIVPRVCLIKTGGERTPLTHGYILRKADLDAAKDEARRGPPTATYPRTSSGRQRRKRSSQTATVASHVSSSSSRHKGDRILSRARGALGV